MSKEETEEQLNSAGRTDAACETRNGATPNSPQSDATAQAGVVTAAQNANAAEAADDDRNASAGPSSPSQCTDKTQQHHRAKSPFCTARGWVALACVAFVLVGLAFHVGIGTPSAFGIQQISAICPLGALETMAGAKGVMLHPLLLFALVVVLIALVGKAFCAWMCPVPWLQKCFRPKKKSSKATSDSESKPSHSCSACPGATTCGKALAPVGGKRDGVHAGFRGRVRLSGVLPHLPRGFDVRHHHRPVEPGSVRRAHLGAYPLPDHPASGSHRAAQMVQQNLPHQCAGKPAVEPQRHATPAREGRHVPAQPRRRLPRVRGHMSRAA